MNGTLKSRLRHLEQLLTTMAAATADAAERRDLWLRCLVYESLMHGSPIRGTDGADPNDLDDSLAVLTRRIGSTWELITDNEPLPDAERIRQIIAELFPTTTTSDDIP